MPSKNKDRLRNRKRTWQFEGGTSFMDLCLTSVCYAFVRVCFLMACGHLLGKDWPLGSRLWCLIVSFLLSHWYPGSSVVLDCIDSWSWPLPYFYVHVAVFQTFLRRIDPDDDRPYIYGVSTSNQILRAGGDICEQNTCNFWLICLSIYCTRVDIGSFTGDILDMDLVLLCFESLI